VSLDMGELFFKISHDTTEQVFNYNWQEKYASNDAALQSLGEASFGFAFRALGIAQKASIISSVRKKQAEVFPSLKRPETDSLFPRCGREIRQKPIFHRLIPCAA